ncbi:MAG: formyltransferase [Deltaproteobacteria bacterium]|nr:formyltransferase [Deltaproteobacteria bacterium]
MRAVVLAYSDVGYVALQVLLELGADIPAVFTHADDPREEIWFRSVAELAARHHLPVFTDVALDAPEWLARLRAWAPEFLFSFYYRRMLAPAVLDTATRGALNLHGSLLPKYRGRSPTNWVLVNGERETGVTLHYMVAKPDAGDIVAQRRVPIDDADTALTLYRKQAGAAEALLRETLPRLAAGTAPRLPNDLTAGSYFGGRTPADGRIDWASDARRLYNLVRAVTHPWPGAFATWQGQPLFVWWAQPVDAPAAGGTPGQVAAIDGAAVTVHTGNGALRLLRLQSHGEDEMDAADWARAHGVTKGTVLA